MQVAVMTDLFKKLLCMKLNYNVDRIYERIVG